ncbi:MAG: Ig-like domain-containing protein, partial [Acidobacteria bacterium]|nr:Ig-like domain-containing protein [Acidobacteriota bacterium]
MRHPIRLLTLTFVALLSSQVASQTPQLRVVDAAPRAEVNQLSDANEIRIVFSEPMVALGRIPSNPAVPWISVSPAIKGTFRWSGTTILFFTPDPATPLPYATTFTVTVDAAATSVAGRSLGSPYTFSFTTPTPRLTSMRWYRRANRFDQPVVLMLDFNQPMRAADVAAHARLTYQPHEVTVPTPSVLERARMLAADPAGLRAFEARVAAARTAAAREDALGLRVTTDWDRERFPPAETLVALETTTVPPAGTWLELTLDAQLPGSSGNQRSGRAQTSVAELDPVFFARRFACQQACNPSGYNGLQMTMPVDVARFAAALSVQDITTASNERAVVQTSTVAPSALDQSWSPELEDAGFDRQPPASTYAYRLDASLEASDGQRLGYPFVGIVENWHERAFSSFGDGHGVWETSGGLQLPFSSRNFTAVTQWLTRLQPGDLMPRILALERGGFRDLPPGTGTTRRLNVTADAVQAHGIDLRSILPEGRGLVWAGLRPGAPIARASRAVPEDRADRSTIVQVTNLGITVKDSPQSTLVFVTRLDNGQPVPGATVNIVNTENRQVWRGSTGADGVVVAPALPLRDPESWYSLSFIVTAEKDGDVGYLASNWNEGILPWDFGHNFQLWESTDILRGSVFTDRGVYRPGETVHAKAILRFDTPSGMRLLPAGSSVDVRVTDSRGREVDRRTLTVNRWSSAEWTWTVPSESTLGNHAVRVALPGIDPPAGNDLAPRGRTEAEWLKQVNASFLVAAYRRPDFRVDAELTTPQPVAGARLSGHIDAAYLFGATLAKRPVRWSITREPDRSIPAPIHERFPESQYAFGYYAESRVGAERIAGAEAVLDATGTIDVAAEAARDVDVAWRYTLEGDVEDVSRQRIANRASIVVHPAPWYIGLKRPAYFADVTTGTTTDVVAVGLDGATAVGVPVTVRLTRIQWNSVRRAEGGGFYTWDTEEIRTPAGEWQVTSAATPQPLQIPVPEGGSYVLSATATDADGRTTKTESHFYALGRGYTAWQRYDHNRITLEPERRTWKPRETARVMIQSHWER